MTPAEKIQSFVSAALPLRVGLASPFAAIVWPGLRPSPIVFAMALRLSL